MSTDPMAGAVGSVLRSALTGLAQRQRSISDNVANIQTPGYTASRVDFETQLRAAVADGGDFDVSPVSAPSTDAARLDGNNVNLDEETLLDEKTGLQYQLTLRALDDRFNLMHTALRS